MKAVALGAERIWQENAGKTGFVVLIDGHTNSVVGMISANDKPQQMRDTLATVKC